MPSLKLEAQRRVLLREQADAADDVGELGAREAQLVLDGLRQQLAVVRELAVDQARGEHDVPELEDHLVLPDAHGERLARRLLGDAHELLQRPGGNVGLEASLQRRLQRASP